MNLKNRLIPLLGLGILFATSCQEDISLTGNDGTFTIQSIAANSEVVASRADGQPTEGTEATDPVQALDPKYYENGFLMTITSSNGKIEYTWKTYDEVFGTATAKESKQYDLGSGTYDADVKLGDINAEGLDSTYFEGKQSFQVFHNNNTPVVVTCYLANAKIKAHFTENFKKYFATYTAGITTARNKELTMTEKDFLYVKPGTVSLKVTASKRESKQTQIFNIGTKELLAKHEYTIKYDVDAAQQKMIVSFNEDIANDKREIVVTDSALIARPPVVNLVGFESGTMIEGSQLLNDVQMHINAEAGLKSVKLTTSPLNTISNGWSDDLELVNIEQTNGNIKYGLIARGFAKGENKLGIIDMSKVLQKLPTGDFTFTVNGTDSLDKAITPILLKVHKMTFGIEVEYEGDVWAKRAKLHVSSKDAPKAVQVERFVNEAWTAIEANTTYEGGYINLTGLTPGEEYKLRVVDSNDTKNISNVLTLTTEIVEQVPNASMDDWYFTRPSGVTYWEVWYANPKDGAQVWGTMNQKTTSEGGTGTTAGNRNGTRYCANSGTIQDTGKDGGEKDYSALIRTVGWGSESNASLNPWAAHVDVGELYLGKYENGPQYNGISFASRPTYFSFDYKYAPGNGGDAFIAEIEIKNGIETIGKSTIDNKGQSTDGQWSTIKEKINYTNTSAKATSICIKFKSGNTIEQSSFVIKPPFANLSNGEFIGSQLWIDNINLIYE